MKQARTIRFFCVLSLVFMSLSYGVLPVAAQEIDTFNYNYILSDDDLTNYQSLTLDEIQRFLEHKQSPLATYVDPITRLSASDVIYRSAQDFQINPKFLLALMQKEQSLVEDTTPQPNQFDWATGYAVCDSCDMNDPLIQKFRGYYNQVYNAAKRIRLSYLSDIATQGVTLSGFGPGIAKLVDNTPVTPANAATAVVYTYTPHLKGNKLLSVVWDRYFSRSYPDGTVLNVQGEPTVWLVDSGTRRAFSNRSVFLSYYPSFDKVVSVNVTELQKYPEGSQIKFPNYSFLRIPSGTVYLLVDETIRGFSSREALRKVGVNPEEIIKVEPEAIIQFSVGQPITEKSGSVLGALMQDKKTGGVYFVQDNKKHPIWSKELMLANYGKRKPIKKTTQELAKIETAEPVVFRDGELIKAKDDTTVYLVSNGLRRPFASMAAFTNLGFEEKNIITTSSAAVGLHAIGEVIPEVL